MARTRERPAEQARQQRHRDRCEDSEEREPDQCVGVAANRREQQYLGDDDTFDRALERFAVAYADQNDADYAEFTDAADERIPVERGV